MKGKRVGVKHLVAAYHTPFWNSIGRALVGQRGIIVEDLDMCSVEEGVVYTVEFSDFSPSNKVRMCFHSSELVFCDES